MPKNSNTDPKPQCVQTDVSSSVLSLENISPYLPYKALIYDSINNIKNYDNCYEFKISNTHRVLNTMKSTEKIVLRPISDLDKEINHKGEILILLECLFLPCGEREILNQWCKENKCWLGQQVSYLIYKQLFKYHFDVFGLIEKGLAVSYHDFE